MQPAVLTSNRMPASDSMEVVWLRRAAVAEAIGGRSNADVVRLTKLGAGTISKMAKGDRVGRRTVRDFADGLELRGEARARLFRAFGYVEQAEEEPPRPTSTRDLEAPVPDIRQLAGAEDLPQNDIDELNAMLRAVIAEKRKRLGLD